MENSEKVRKGLKCCVTTVCGANAVKDCDIECPYFHEGAFCKNALHGDAMRLVHHLESSLAQAEWERDAAVADIRLLAEDPDFTICDCCTKSPESFLTGCSKCGFKWRGVCEENTKQDETDRGEEG